MANFIRHVQFIGRGLRNYALLRNRKELKSVPAEPKGRILMSASERDFAASS